ncbi:thiamine diphosphokinase [Selenomonas sp. oral taxon 920]|uniref:thiamine diphosphokinase n=1 Tax=Selenomonas sp. oral taxon 920 TaxID=1884263 RepID=UPI000840D31A|nr:thiamine diphosphokinase [Selenomonas sp. oral taxon 920]AOH47789.1 thiamine diphosphokinase [Selenomonas sp. oral taxon 920]
MHEYKHALILPTLHATLPCLPSQELVCLGGGRTPTKDWLTQLFQQSEKGGTDRPILAIDRGVNICYALKLPPVHLIGDGDSASKAAWTWAETQGAQVHSFPPKKDFTDTELTLHIAAERFARPLIILTGAFGGRLDHLMSTAAVAAHADISCVLADECETLFYLHAGESLTVTCDTPPRAISLLPFTEECTGVTTHGLYWELRDACITNRASLAISNVLARENTKKTFAVSIKSGVLGVYLCHKE